MRFFSPSSAALFASLCTGFLTVLGGRVRPLGAAFFAVFGSGASTTSGSALASASTVFASSLSAAAFDWAVERRVRVVLAVASPRPPDMNVSSPAPDVRFRVVLVLGLTSSASFSTSGEAALGSLVVVVARDRVLLVFGAALVGGAAFAAGLARFGGIVACD